MRNKIIKKIAIQKEELDGGTIYRIIAMEENGNWFDEMDERYCSLESAEAQFNRCVKHRKSLKVNDSRIIREEYI